MLPSATEDQCTVTCNTPNYNGNAADSCPSGGPREARSAETALARISERWYWEDASLRLFTYQGSEVLRQARARAISLCTPCKSEQPVSGSHSTVRIVVEVGRLWPAGAVSGAVSIRCLLVHIKQKRHLSWVDKTSLMWAS
eukprot:6468377-Amphidinium_carterae.2